VFKLFASSHRHRNYKKWNKRDKPTVCYPAGLLIEFILYIRLKPTAANPIKAQLLTSIKTTGMNVKNVSFLLAFSCISMASLAQSGSAWIKGGVNFANISRNDDGEVDDANMLTSFHVGIMGDLTIAKVLSIQPGILFTGKGSKIESGTSSSLTYYKATTNPMYIEIPVNVALKLPLPGANSNFFVGAGPYIAMGVAGKRKLEGRYLGVTYDSKESIEFSNDDPSTFNNEEGAGLGVLRRFDYGFNATAGFQLSGLLLSVNYGHGLAKLQSGADNAADNKNKHRVLGLSVGFKL
jgi:hypothetical protein